MGHQEDVFLSGEGDQWHLRNKDKIKVDPVWTATEALGIKPFYVTEVGCGTGWRLVKYADFHRAYCYGIDPSEMAIEEGDDFLYENRFDRMVELDCGGFDRIISSRPSNLFIFGFCLYLCDRENLSKVVYDADENLRDGGYLVIHDFDPEYPHKVPYHHVTGLFSYKMDYSKLWLANPAYSLVHKNVYASGEAVWVLKKDIAAGWPEQVMP